MHTVMWCNSDLQFLLSRCYGMVVLRFKCWTRDLNVVAVSFTQNDSWQFVQIGYADLVLI